MPGINSSSHGDNVWLVGKHWSQGCGAAHGVTMSDTSAPSNQSHKRHLH